MDLLVEVVTGDLVVGGAAHAQIGQPLVSFLKPYGQKSRQVTGLHVGPTVNKRRTSLMSDKK